MFCVVVIDMTQQLPSNLSGSDSNEAAGNVTSPPFTGVFTSPATAANTKTTRFGHTNGYGGLGPAFHFRRNSEDSSDMARRNGRRKKGKRRKNALPPVTKDDQGAVYLPRSDTSRQQPLLRRHDPGGPKVLPSVSRFSNGDVYLSHEQQRQSELEPANSDQTPSSVVLAQIDDIYGYNPTSQPQAVPRYFSNSRPPPRQNFVVTEERDHPMNDESSVRFS